MSNRPNISAITVVLAVISRSTTPYCGVDPKRGENRT
jgi:hypothetical protein